MSRTLVCCVLLFWLAGQSADVRGQDKAPRTDRYGVPLPPGALLRLGVSALRTPTSAGCFSPDGRTLAVLDHQGRLRILRLPGGQLLREWEGHGEPPAWTRALIAWSPDGKHLLAGHERGRFTLWEATTGGRQAEMRLSKVPHSAQAISADFTTLAAVTADGKARLWTVATGELLRTWPLANQPEAPNAVSGRQDTGHG